MQVFLMTWEHGRRGRPCSGCEIFSFSLRCDNAVLTTHAEARPSRFTRRSGPPALQPAAGMLADGRKRKFEPSAAEAGSGGSLTSEAAIAGTVAHAAHPLLSTMDLSGLPSERPADRAWHIQSGLSPLTAAAWTVPDGSGHLYAATATMPGAEWPESQWREHTIMEHLFKPERMDTRPRFPGECPATPEAARPEAAAPAPMSGVGSHGAGSRWREEAMERLSVLERMATLESQGACQHEVERQLQAHQMWLQRQQYVDGLELEPALKRQVAKFLADCRKLEQITLAASCGAAPNAPSANAALALPTVTGKVKGPSPPRPSSSGLL